MKKAFVSIILILGMSLFFVSCKENKHNEHTESEMHEAHDKDVAMHTHYQCPMDCEKGKTYDENGTCPVCEMNLKEVEHDDHDKDKEHKGQSDAENNTKDEHAGHNHD